MISVLTLTYKRHHLLEEAIQSFLSQNVLKDSEMVIINDNPDVEYVFDHPMVKIINYKNRFKSISEKLKWGYRQCKYDYIYRLDDDDLLTPWALKNVQIDIEINPGYDIYR
ncbi:MAG: glycosyltransferase family 2 protein, partial [Bacteroidota bacterium]